MDLRVAHVPREGEDGNGESEEANVDPQKRHGGIVGVPRARAKRKPRLEPLPIEVPKIHPIHDWMDNPENTFENWKAKAEKAKTPEDYRRFMARAYVSNDGFFHYCQDFICDKQMHPFFHGRICDHVVGHKIKRYPVKRVRMTLAFRGSWKSHIKGFGGPTWYIAREYVLYEEVRKIDDQIREARGGETGVLTEDEVGDLNLDDLVAERKVLTDRGYLSGVNIRIGIQSESMDLAEDTVQTCCNIMDLPRWQELFGVHKGKNGPWGRAGAVSALRTNASLRDATLFTISLKAPRVGSHPDVIFSDDFQSENSASSATMRDKSWKMWKANFQLIPPPSISLYSEILVAGTRWHSADNYGRIIKENETCAERDRVHILTLPVCTENGTPTCPIIYDKDAIKSLKSEGIDKFNTQYLLKPVGGKSQPFHKEMIRYHSGNFSQRDREVMQAVTGADFCWVEAARRGSTTDDHSVVFTFLRDASWRFYLVDWWREQVTRRETLEEIQRQMHVHGSTDLGLSVSDRKHVEEDMRRMEFELKEKGTPFAFNETWVSDLKGGEGVDAATHKSRKHIGVLQPIFQAGKLFIPVGMGWLEEELLDCPRGATDDGLDAMVCCVSVAVRPGEERAPNELENVSPLNMSKFYESIFKPGNFDVWGNRIRRSHSLKGRRPRNRTPLP